MSYKSLLLVLAFWLILGGLGVIPTLWSWHWWLVVVGMIIIQSTLGSILTKAGKK